MPLLRFRHFFRSSYAIDHDPMRLAERVRELPEADAAVRADLGRLIAALAETAK